MMKQRRTHRERNFGPLQDKTLANILCHLFVTEFGYQNKVLFAEAMIHRILETIDAFVKPRSALKPGQALWMAVIHDGRKHTLKSMKETPQVPVILDLVTDNDLQALANGASFPDIRRRRHARLLDQALAQGGVLAQTDLAALTLTSEEVVRRDIIQVQQAEERRLPHRGSVQDIGPTLSHKVEVARLLEAGYLEPEICRMLHPVHNLRSVERYAQYYKNVLKLLDHGFAPSEISSILSLSMRLVNDYIQIVKEHHPAILSGNGHLQKSSATVTENIPEGQ
jgi:hypothetical protein